MLAGKTESVHEGMHLEGGWLLDPRGVAPSSSAPSPSFPPGLFFPSSGSYFPQSVSFHPYCDQPQTSSLCANHSSGFERRPPDLHSTPNSSVRASGGRSWVAQSDTTF